MTDGNPTHAEPAMANTPPLYVRLMGDSAAELAAPVLRLHGTQDVTQAHGRLRIEHGRHFVARLVATLLRLPKPSATTATQLVVITRADGERWVRSFNGRRLETRQYESAGDLAERVGILEFRFRLSASGGSLAYIQREVALMCGWFRCPIPAAWAPRVAAREDPAGNQRIHVDVRVVLPAVGPLIAYAGFIDIDDTP